MVPPRKTPRTRYWYKVSVETLRGWAMFFFLIALAVLGYFGYRLLEQSFVKREAAAVMDEAGLLVQRLRREEGLASFMSEYRAAREGLGEAQASFDEGAFSKALASAHRSRTLLASILDALRHRGEAGEAQFIAVQGGVEYRRGERGEWEEARSRVALRSGDYVKTAPNGSAEIMFLDGTLYTVRPNTLFLVTRTADGAGQPPQRSIAMEYGWVNLSTSQSPSRVSTPSAEARVDRESEAMVAYDQEAKVGRFAAYRGGLEVSARGGLSRELGALEQVVQRGDLLSAARPLPGRPLVVEPPDNLEVSLDGTKELVLAWEPVRGASRYALQVSRNRLFVDNVIDVENRTRTRATLGLRGEGSFLWRVAAYGDEGVKGPWSTARAFQVAALARGGGDGDKTPPTLELHDVKSYGSIFIIGGRTEPGAEVTINGELVTVEADGSFTKTVQLSQEGWSFVEIRALDTWGNETLRRHRVFVESL